MAVAPAQVPPAPSYTETMADILRGQRETAPAMFALESSPIFGQPAYANLDLLISDIITGGTLANMAKYYPKAAGLESAYLQELSRGELGRLTSPETGLGAYQQAFNQLTPGYAEAGQGLGQFATQMARSAQQQPAFTPYEQGVSPYMAGQYAGQVQGPTADLTLGGMTAYRPGQILGGLGEYQVGQQFLSQPAFQSGQFAGAVGGPQLQSGLGAIDQGLVQSYMDQIPGAQDIAEQLTQQASEDLALGGQLSPEEIRQATQAAREAYAARGTALGNQAIGAEIMARSELSDQRLRERQATAAQAANLSAQLYTPALQQAFQRQAGAETYGLGAQGQLFGQAMGREQLGQATQAQAFQQLGAREQALAGAQAQAFQQRMGQEALGQGAQSQEFTQRAGLQELGMGLQNQQFGQAMQREQLGGTAQAQAFQQALQRSQQETARRQNALALQSGYGQAAAGAMSALQGAQSPILQAFYKNPVLGGAVGGAQQISSGLMQMAGPALSNPESQMGFQSAFLPFQGQLATNIAGMQSNAMLQGAQIQANAAKRAGTMGMIGQLGGAAITGAMMLCWVAREVYGAENPKWLQFREWMLNKAPKWLLALYIAFGERFANFIKDKPTIKGVIRRWMDSKIQPL